METLSGVIKFIVIIFTLFLGAISYHIDGYRLTWLESEEHRIQAVAAFDADSKSDRDFRRDFDIESLVDSGDYIALQSLIRLLQDDYEKHGGPRSLNSVFGYFSGGGDTKQAMLDEWVNQYPDSWIPYAARANFYLSKGWSARGKKFRSETTDLQFHNMELAFKKSEADLIKVLEMKPEFPLIYRDYLSIAKNNSGQFTEDELLAMALDKSPGEYYILFDYLGTQHPKWGGSYAAMRRHAIDFQEYRDLNPKIFALLGVEFYERAQKSIDDKNYKECIDLMNKAFSYGDLYAWRNRRAFCFGKLDQYDEQLADLNVVASKGEFSGTHVRIAKVYKGLGDTEKAIFHAEKAIAINPKSRYYKNLRGWIYKGAGDKEKALASYKETMDLDPYNVYAAENIAKIYLQDRRREEALPYLEVITRYGDDKNPLAWLTYGEVLKHLGMPRHMEAFAVYLQLVDRNDEREFKRINELEAYLKGKDYWHPEEI